ncbi:MAG: gliding motility-associated C-terminal domain-containing protein, partial [Cytophagaceae bacterium]
GLFIDRINWKGCVITDTFKVRIANDPLPHDSSVCFRGPVTLNAASPGATSYQWQNNSTSPLFNATAAGTYWVRINYADCIFTDTIVLSPVSPKLDTVSARTCTGTPYTLPSGLNVTQPGSYIDTVRYRAGCDSLIRRIELQVDTIALRQESHQICSNAYFILPWGDTARNNGIYTHAIQSSNQCDSIQQEVTLEVLPIQRVIRTANICAGETYALPSGTLVNNPGTYLDTLNYAWGCDSLITTVNLEVRPVFNASIATSICEGASFTLPSGMIVQQAGIYLDTVRYAAGCDSLFREIRLLVQPVSHREFSATICEGSSYTLPSGINVSASGTYSDTLHSVLGCDSVIRRSVITVRPLTRAIIQPTICEGANYVLPSGRVIAVAGTYSDTLRYQAGCDSIIYSVNLQVKEVRRQSAQAWVCEAQQYSLPSGLQVNAGATYQDTIRYTNGCDSLISTIQVSARTLLRRSSMASICNGSAYILPSGSSIYTQGIYRDTLRYVVGCDSLITTVNLAVVQAERRTKGVTICSGDVYLLPSGQLTSSAGVYLDTVRTRSGCDSVITRTTLTISPTPMLSLSKSNDIDCIMGTATLRASGGTGYTWSPAVLVSSVNSASTSVHINQTTTFYVTATTAVGCKRTDSIEVKVLPLNADKGFEVATAFTPDGDGRNDCFGVPHWGMVSDFSLSIYNRSGKLLWKTNNTGECWDGRYRGVIQPIDVYVYQVSATTICG